jgi:putative endonuclease
VSFYVYILANHIDCDLYKGVTENPLLRLEQHNAGERKFTSTKIPWHIVAIFEFDNKKLPSFLKGNLKNGIEILYLN